MGMKMETSFDHVWLIHDYIEKIASQTGTGIRVPDVSNLKELPKKYCIWIRGPTVDSVYIASTLLNVSFILRCFEIKYVEQHFKRLNLIARDFCRCN